MKDPILPVDGEARQIAKHLMRTARSGALATNDAAGGVPFASLVAVATDVDGSPLILTSQLSAHTKLLEADARCSLLLSSSGKGDPLAHPRVTLLAEARRVERSSPEGERIRRRYLAHQPKASLYVDFPDFAFWRLDIASASLNGGFGRAYRMGRADVLAPMDGLDGLLDLEADAVEHMNADHSEAVALYATRLCGARDGAWRLTGIDPEGLLLALGDEIVRLTFPEPLTGPEELRPMLVRLAQDARNRSTAD
ncbi:HugZ family protein [Microvirga sp. GCM10011540]|uniref:HugZ family pyridoxamine 5'-phosphate oxidase n=1 Tax=Microvirga sp. GCM10011540 TaxID=3317338 RepID=UPI00360DE16C